MTAIRDLGEFGVLVDEKAAQLLQCERDRITSEEQAKEVKKHNRMVDDIENLPFEIYNRLVQEDGKVYYLDGGMIPCEDNRPLLVAEGFNQDKQCKRRNPKNHEWAGGPLRQTNKKWSALKESQKTLIYDHIKIAHENYVENLGKLPMHPSKQDSLLEVVYSNIKRRGIWIPYGEFKQAACKAIARLNRRRPLCRKEE
jgi:hypothetical protein